ncbi:MAG TPA: zf-HC2 domain-containing protein, partial [Polyangia bacterium]
MTCAVEKLSALVDGDLSARQAKKVRAHVEACASCKRALADLETMKRGLGAMPERAGEDNWSVLVNRLAAQPLPGRQSDRRWMWPALSWRVVVPSLTVIAILAGGGAWLRWHKGRGLSADVVIAQAENEFRKADQHYRLAVDELRSVAEKDRRDWPLP